MIENPLPSQVILGAADGSGTVSVDHDAYLAFDHQITDALDKLVERWISEAAPPARLRHLRRQRGAL